MKHFTLVVCLALAVALAIAKDKKKHGANGEEEITQALQAPPELPAYTVAEAGHVGFQVTALHGEGLLSQQLREALKSIMHQDRPVVKLRAFVAGTGDTRRVQAVVGEVATERRVSLPALTVIQVGQLPRNGAQVVIEAVTLEKKSVNAGGVQMAASKGDYASEPLLPVLPHLRTVLEGLRASMPGAEEVLKVTCYPTSLDDIDALRRALSSEFPKAVADFVQPQRAMLASGATCEAVGRKPAQPEGAGKLVFTGAQLAFGTKPADAKLAFERLGKTLAQAGTSYSQVVHLSLYSLSRSTAEVAEKAVREFFDPARPPALTVVMVEGLPSLDASFAVDAEAVLSSK